MHSFLMMALGAAAGGEMVTALLHRQWLSAGVWACILLAVVATTKPEPINTFHHHARRALRAAGILAGMGTFIAACSLLAFPTKPQHVVPILLIAVVVGAVFGGGAYVAITALRAAWDTAIARVRGHR